MRESEENLFRREAVEALRIRDYGRPIAKLPRMWAIFGALVFTALLFAAWYLLTSEYSRKETVRGWLIPDKGLVRLSAGQYGLVDELLVEEGDQVSKGDVIMVLSSDTSVESGQRATDVLLAEIDREEEELLNQIDLTIAGAVADRDSLTAAIQAMDVEAESLRKQISRQRERIEIVSDLLNRTRPLQQEGVVPYAEVAVQQENLTTQQQTLEHLNQRLQSFLRERELQANHLQKLPIEQEKRTSEIRARLSEISQRKAELVTRGQHVVVSPIVGMVATLGVKTGNSVDPQTTITSILPSSTSLYAEIFIPSRAIGFVEKGKQVRLMYEAFPHQRFGSAEGIVNKVGNVVLRPEEIPTPLRMEESAYRVQVALNHQSISAFGNQFPLRPGMALDAEIILEQRTFFQWLLEPIAARAGRT